MTMKLTHNVVKHVVAFIRGPLLRGGLTGREHGTMTLISYRGHCLGLTCKHVVGDWEFPVFDEQVALALKVERPVPGRLLYKSPEQPIDEPKDLAVFLLFESYLIKGGKSPLSVVTAAEPAKDGEMLLAIGFPGHERITHPEKIMYPLYETYGKSACASNKAIVIQDMFKPRESQTIKFGGMSGGAILRVKEDDTYEFLGIVSEGRGQHDVTDSQYHKTNSQPPNVQNEFWIFGIPVSTAWLDRLIDSQPPQMMNIEPLKIISSLKIEGAQGDGQIPEKVGD